MAKKSIAAGVVVVVLLLTTIVFIAAGPSPPPISVRHAKSVQSGDLVTATFEIVNHTARSYFISPVWVEIRNGQVLEKCFDWNSQSFPIDEFGPHSSKSRTFFMTNLPTGSPLRLRLSASEQLTGLRGRLACLEWSLINHKNPLVSLKPFQTNFSFPRTIEIVSDEFVESDSSLTSEGTLQK